MPRTVQMRQTPGQHIPNVYYLEAPAWWNPNPDWVLYDNHAGLQPQQLTDSYRTGTDRDYPVESATSRGDFYRAILHENERSKYDNGHAFYTTKCTFRTTAPENELWLARASGPYSGWGFRGVLLPGDRFNNRDLYPEAVKLSELDIGEWGTQAISLTTPTKSSASLSTTLLETLTSVLPMMPGLSTALAVKNADSKYDAKRLHSKLGGEHLNIQFGIKPLIGDVKKIIRSLKSANRQIEQMVRDSGKVVRRRYTFPSTITHSFDEEWGSAYRTLQDSTSTGMYADVERYKMASRESTSRETYSFSGAYSYHYEIPSDLLGQLIASERAADKLLGTRVDLETLWNIMPWSWLVDWVGNIGNVISNATNFAEDGLVLRYGYLMRHTVAQNIYRVPAVRTHNPSNGTGGWMRARTHTFRRETKERAPAGPYGFTLSTDSFSESQWAILAALGMTKSPKLLRP